VPQLRLAGQDRLLSVVAGYPGPPGSHSSVACEQLVPVGERRPLPSLSAVVDATTALDCTVGVLPIESSLSGPVAETHDLLFRSALSIVAETVIPVEHCLVARPGTVLEDVRVVRSHPEALAQCRRLLRELGITRRLAAATTADAAREVSEREDGTEAAIASRQAGALYGLRVLVPEAGDRSDASTRFVAVKPYTELVRDGRPWRSALTFCTDHAPGALYRALGPIADLNVNLVQLVSRPLPDAPWRYRFDMVVDGHPLDANVAEALRQLRTLTRELRVLGSYPAEHHG
jgi:prephenate dehydratase